MKAQMTLVEAVTYFKKYDNCHNFMVQLRWPNGVVRCPRCDSDHVKYLAKARVWKCYGKHDHAKFSLKTGTIFEDSALGLDKWMPAVWQVVNCRNGISSWELHRALGVTQKTAWFMLHRIRLAMQDNFHGGMLNGECEIDETFIGGKARNMHKDKRLKMRSSTNWEHANKTIVLGLLERETEKKPRRVRTSVIPDRKRDTIAPEVQAHIEAGSKVYSDDYGSIWGQNIGSMYEREMVSHFECYVKGNVHTNTLENFWSLLKRGIGGTYVSVEPFHLFRYVDEQAFRYNTRKDIDGNVISDYDRFKMALSQIVGRRLTYAQLTGKEAETASAEAF